MYLLFAMIWIVFGTMGLVWFIKLGSEAPAFLLVLPILAYWAGIFVIATNIGKRSEKKYLASIGMDTPETFTSYRVSNIGIWYLNSKPLFTAATENYYYQFDYQPNVVRVTRVNRHGASQSKDPIVSIPISAISHFVDQPKWYSPSMKIVWKPDAFASADYIFDAQKLSDLSVVSINARNQFDSSGNKLLREISNRNKIPVKDLISHTAYFN